MLDLTELNVPTTKKEYNLLSCNIDKAKVERDQFQSETIGLMDSIKSIKRKSTLYINLKVIDNKVAKLQNILDQVLWARLDDWKLKFESMQEAHCNYMNMINVRLKSKIHKAILKKETQLPSLE